MVRLLFDEAVGGRPRSGPDRARLTRFLDREFDGEPGLAREFPLLLAPHNLDRSWVYERDGQIVAHAVWRPLTLLSGERRIGAAGIGLVTTARDWRGRGLASQLVGHCLAGARRAGTELVVLFAPARSLYTRLGFVPAGRELLSWTRAAAPVPSGARVRRGGPLEAPKLLSLLERHRLRVERSVEEFASLLGIPGVCCHLVERGSDVVAYCVEGKGRDLRGVIHEWAGDPQALAGLFAAITARRPAPLPVLSPETSPPPGCEPGGVQALAQLRILDPGRLGENDAVRLFGDPGSPARLPIYVWGLDSI
ncbi:MAG: GNAT family N-acetyltransferase [Myxococcota bacterium]